MRHALILAGLLAAGALLSGCGGEATTESPAEPKAPAVPFSFEQNTKDAEVALKIDRAIGAWPVLHKRIYDEGVAELKKFAVDAVAARAEPIPDYTPEIYARELTWTVASHTQRIASLRQIWYESTGGAHPNHGYGSIVWDIPQGQKLTRQQLFKPAGPADVPIGAALCDAIHKARAEKGVEEGRETEQTWPCPSWRDADFELAASTTPGKIGGVTFLFDPYAIGSYAEGEYEVTLPQSLFREVTAPRWAGEFAGEPRPPARPKE